MKHRPISRIALATGLALAATSAVLMAAPKDDDLPLSRDALFGDPPPAPKAKPVAPKPPAPASRDELFGLDEPAAKPAMPAKGLPASRDELFGDVAKEPAVTGPAAAQSSALRGFFQAEMARTYGGDAHWSKMAARLELGTQGQAAGLKYKLSARVDHDLVFDLYDRYPGAVRHDQRSDFQWREVYADFTAGGWDFRAGRQHVVWGEMVGMFFADVVSARDLREFILPEFSIQRIPQWAVRAEYFKGDFHGELLWVPYPSYDRIGKPGSEFYPYPPPPPNTLMTFEEEDKPAHGWRKGNWGARVGTLQNGWDLSAFAYRSWDIQQTVERTPVVAGLLYSYRPIHDRISQAGATLAKDLGAFVLKAEGVYTKGRRFNVARLTQPDGLVPQNTVDWAVGLDFHPGGDLRINTQLFERVHFDHDPDIIPQRRENGGSLLVAGKPFRNWEAEALVISSFNRSDWLFRPKMTWNFERDWRFVAGADIFHGPPVGLFGRYADKDRLYMELRRDF